MILDNLSAHKAKKIRAWCARNNVEVCFTPTYSSWANPAETHCANDSDCDCEDNCDERKELRSCC